MKAWMWTSAFVAVLCANARQLMVASAPECCSTCIAKVANDDYEPLVYEQCTKKPNGANRVCCFECGNLGEPQYTDDVSYEGGGTVPEAKSGKWIRFQWSDIEKVTFITLKEGQKKLTTPKLTDPTAQSADSYFMVCAKSPGELVMRGWGNDTCRQATKETKIKIVQGDEGATCDGKIPDAPEKAADNDQCNLQRASWKVGDDGKKQCVCVSDWEGPPMCDKWPLWKWIFTMGGGVAALFSIIISVRAFLKSREKKNLEMEADDLAAATSKNDEVETLHITPNRRSSGAPNAQYNREMDHISTGIRKAPDREFTL